MDTSELFLDSLADLERYAAIGDDYSMLRATALLRQMLLDENPLIHQVNRDHRLKLKFPICGRKYRDIVLADGPVFYSALGGIHPSGLLGHQLEEVPLGRFLATPVLKLGDHLLTVCDLVSISANVLGGVHKGNPKTEKEQALVEFNKRVSVQGQTISAAQMKPIILVALDGLRPLRVAIQAA